jgi:hypothetical protein
MLNAFFISRWGFVGFALIAAQLIHTNPIVFGALFFYCNITNFTFLS